MEKFIEKDGQVVVSSCICGSSKLKPYKNVISAPVMHVEFCSGKILVNTLSRFMLCEDCGLVIQSPRMSDERISEYYESGMYRKTLGLSEEAMDKDEKYRAERVALWVRETAIPENLLDIGSSRGYFAEAMRVPFDTDELLTSYSKILTASMNNSGTYDMVSALHVLEHVPHPYETLLEWAEKSSRYLLLEVPNDYSPGGPLRFAHTYQFNYEILAGWLKDAGFSVIKTSYDPALTILAERNPK